MSLIILTNKLIFKNITTCGVQLRILLMINLNINKQIMIQTIQRFIALSRPILWNQIKTLFYNLIKIKKKLLRWFAECSPSIMFRVISSTKTTDNSMFIHGLVSKHAVYHSIDSCHELSHESNTLNTCLGKKQKNKNKNK